MTDGGTLVLIVYSSLVVLGFILKEFKRGEKGWKGALLIPILILLMNM